MSNMKALKEFLDSIPQFIADLEPGDAYLKVEGAPENVWKSLVDYEVTDQGDGFTVSGKLALSLIDLIGLPGWHVFKSRYPDVVDDKLYQMFLSENPIYSSDFNLEQFCEIFNDFYCEFLNDSGILEGAIDLNNNTIRLIEYSDEEVPEEIAGEDEEETDAVDSVEE